MDNVGLNAMHHDRHEADAYRRIELITGTMRRRRWTNQEKAAIVAESTRPGGQCRGSRSPVRWQLWDVANLAAQGDR
jgi:transposase-like protein